MGSDAEYCGAYAHMRRAKGDCCRKVGTHAHGEKRKPIAAGNLCGERKVRSRSLVDRRDAHQPRNSKAVIIAARRKKGISVLRLDAGLLRLGAGVYLGEE